MHGHLNVKLANTLSTNVNIKLLTSELVVTMNIYRYCDEGSLSFRFVVLCAECQEGDKVNKHSSSLNIPPSWLFETDSDKFHNLWTVHRDIFA